MAILLEGMTLVFANETIEAKYPDGLYGFISNWDNGSFCTDGTISKISFFEVGDGLDVLMAMPSMGLELGIDTPLTLLYLCMVAACSLHAHG